MYNYFIEEKKQKQKQEEQLLKEKLKRDDIKRKSKLKFLTHFLYNLFEKIQKK